MDNQLHSFKISNCLTLNYANVFVCFNKIFIIDTEYISL